MDLILALQFLSKWECRDVNLYQKVCMIRGSLTGGEGPNLYACVVVRPIKNSFPAQITELVEAQVQGNECLIHILTLRQIYTTCRAKLNLHDGQISFTTYFLTLRSMALQ